MTSVAASKREVAVKKEQTSAKSGKPRKRGRGKAFDSVLEKEDVEGPIVVTSAGNDGQCSSSLEYDLHRDKDLQKRAINCLTRVSSPPFLQHRFVILVTV